MISDQRIIELALGNGASFFDELAGNECEYTFTQSQLVAFAHALQAEWINSLVQAGEVFNGNVCVFGDSCAIANLDSIPNGTKLYALSNDEKKPE